MANPAAVISIGGDLSQIERQVSDFLSKTQTKFKNINLTSNNNIGKALGQISSNASEFNKSLEASNARVIAFGASVGIIYNLQRAFQELASVTIQVDKDLTQINNILNISKENLSSFSGELFNIARGTGTSFSEAARAATEFSRQGLGVEETLNRTKDALILSRLSGQDLEESTKTLTAALNSFNKEALTSTEIINKFANVDASFAVSSSDLAEAVKRVGSTAADAGVDLDHLLGIVTSVQQTTSRGGAVIGNALKTIFTRLQNPQVLSQLEDLGVGVRNSVGEIESADRVLQNLATSFQGFTKGQQAQTSQLIGGVFQINVLKAALADLSKEYSVASSATRVSRDSTDEAIKRNEELNQSLSALVNTSKQNFAQLANGIGSQSVAPGLKELLKSFNGIVGSLNDQDTESVGATIGRGLLGGLTKFLLESGIPAVGGIIVKLLGKFSTFAKDAASNLFDANSIAQEQKTIQGSITEILQRNPSLINEATSSSEGRLRVESEILNTLISQAQIVAEISSFSKSVAGDIAPSVSQAKKTINVKTFAAGYIPQTIQQQEIRGARNGGYSPGAVIKAPSSIGGVMNTREEVKYLPGFRQPFINPPEYSLAGRQHKQDSISKLGVNPYSYDGFIPNLAEDEDIHSLAKQKGFLGPIYKSYYPLDKNKKPFNTIKRTEKFPTFTKGKEEDLEGVAGFFAADEKVAKKFRYADSVVTKSFYAKFENPYVIDAKGEFAGKIQFGDTGKEFRDAVRSKKYDGIIIKNTKDEGDLYVSLNSKNTKLADTHTYDENGKRIPLSQRLNTDVDNFNYSNGFIPNLASPKDFDKIRALLTGSKFKSIVYQKASGETAEYNKGQHHVKRDLLVGAQAPKGYKNWGDMDAKTNSIVLWTNKSGQKESDFRRFNFSGIKKIIADGETYEFDAGGFIPNFAKKNIWDIPNQEISSSETSVNKNKLPKTFSLVKFAPNTINADIGGGKFDNVTEFLSEKGVENKIFDPFNRSKEHNQKIVKQIRGGQSDTATVNNVLNVIKEQKNRDTVIAQAADSINPQGKAYFLIYEGDGSGEGIKSSKGWQENRKADSYIGEIRKYFQKVSKKRNLLVAEEPIKKSFSGFIPNLNIQPPNLEAALSPEVLASFKDPKEILKYIKTLDVPKFQGSSRVYIPINKDKGVKIALNKAGIAQNEIEFPILNSDYFAKEQYSDILPEGHGFDENNFRFGYLQHLDKPTAQDFKDTTGKKKAHFLFETPYDFISKKEIKLSPTEEKIKQFLTNYGLEEGDFIGGRNVGILQPQKQLKLLDVGYNNQVFKDHYLRSRPRIGEFSGGFIPNFARKDEIFKFLSATYDVSKTNEDIENKKINPELRELNIKDYAEKVLGLNREQHSLNDLENIQGSFIVGLNGPHLANINEEKLNTPGVMTDITMGKGKDKKQYRIVIDGNHRIAKSYLSGKDSLPFNYLTEKQIKKYKISNEGFIPNFATLYLPKIKNIEIQKRLEKTFLKGQDYQNFYRILNSAFQNPKDAVTYGGIASALSPQVPDYVASPTSVNVYKKFKQTGSTQVDDYLDDPVGIEGYSKVSSLGLFGPKGARRIGLSKALTGQTLARTDYNKTRHYAQAIAGDYDSFPIDTNVLRATFGETKEGILAAPDARKLIRLARNTAGTLGIQAADLQAGIFKGANERFANRYSIDKIQSLRDSILASNEGFIPNFAKITSLAPQNDSSKLIRGRNTFQMKWLQSKAKSLGVSIDDPDQISKLSQEFAQKYPNNQLMMGLSGGFVPNFAFEDIDKGGYIQNPNIDNYTRNRYLRFSEEKEKFGKLYGRIKRGEANNITAISGLGPGDYIRTYSSNYPRLEERDLFEIQNAGDELGKEKRDISGRSINLGVSKYTPTPIAPEINKENIINAIKKNGFLPSSSRDLFKSDVLSQIAYLKDDFKDDYFSKQTITSIFGYPNYYAKLNGDSLARVILGTPLIKADPNFSTLLSSNKEAAEFLSNLQGEEDVTPRAIRDFYVNKNITNKSLRDVVRSSDTSKNILDWVAQNQNSSQFEKPRVAYGAAGQQREYTWLELLDKVQEEDLINGPKTSVPKVFERVQDRISQNLKEQIEERAKTSNRKFSIPSYLSKETDNVKILKDELSLIEEGNALDHCVGGYGDSCSDINPKTGLPKSLIVSTGKTTAELNPLNQGGKISAYQIRGKGNAQPPKEELQLIRDYVTENGLTPDFNRGFIPNFAINRQLLKDLVYYNKAYYSLDASNQGKIENGKITLYRGVGGRGNRWRELNQKYNSEIPSDVINDTIFEHKKPLDYSANKNEFLSYPLVSTLLEYQTKNFKEARDIPFLSTSFSESQAKTFSNENEKTLGSKKISLSRVLNKKSLNVLSSKYGERELKEALLHLSKLSGGKGIGFDINDILGKYSEYKNENEIVLLNKGNIPNFADKTSKQISQEKLKFVAAKLYENPDISRKEMAESLNENIAKKGYPFTKETANQLMAKVDGILRRKVQKEGKPTTDWAEYSSQLYKDFSEGKITSSEGNIPNFALLNVTKTANSKIVENLINRKLSSKQLDAFNVLQNSLKSQKGDLLEVRKQTLDRFKDKDYLKGFLEDADGFIPNFSGVSDLITKKKAIEPSVSKYIGIQKRISSEGFIPSVNKALNREMAAGYSPSQVKVGFDSRLRKSGGLGVYNTTEGSLSNAIALHLNQGKTINEIQSQGSAAGNIPNFASDFNGVDLSAIVGSLTLFGFGIKSVYSEFEQLKESTSRVIAANRQNIESLLDAKDKFAQTQIDSGNQLKSAAAAKAQDEQKKIQGSFSGRIDKQQDIISKAKAESASNEIVKKKTIEEIRNRTSEKTDSITAAENKQVAAVKNQSQKDFQSNFGKVLQGNLDFKDLSSEIGELTAKLGVLKREREATPSTKFGDIRKAQIREEETTIRAKLTSLHQERSQVRESARQEFLKPYEERIAGISSSAEEKRQTVRAKAAKEIKEVRGDFRTKGAQNSDAIKQAQDSLDALQQDLAAKQNKLIKNFNLSNDKIDEGVDASIAKNRTAIAQKIRESRKNIQTAKENDNFTSLKKGGKLDQFIRGNGLIIAGGISSVAGIAQESIGKDTEGKARAGAAVGAVGTVANFAATGGLFGGPAGAIGGAVIGLAVSIKSVADAAKEFNVQNLINNFEKLRETSERTSDSITNYINNTESLANALSDPKSSPTTILRLQNNIADQLAKIPEKYRAQVEATGGSIERLRDTFLQINEDLNKQKTQASAAAQVSSVLRKSNEGFFSSGVAFNTQTTAGKNNLVTVFNDLVDSIDLTKLEASGINIKDSLSKVGDDAEKFKKAIEGIPGLDLESFQNAFKELNSNNGDVKQLVKELSNYSDKAAEAREATKQIAKDLQRRREVEVEYSLTIQKITKNIEDLTGRISSAFEETKSRTLNQNRLAFSNKTQPTQEALEIFSGQKKAAAPFITPIVQNDFDKKDFTKGIELNARLNDVFSNAQSQIFDALTQRFKQASAVVDKDSSSAGEGSISAKSKAESERNRTILSTLFSSVQNSLDQLSSGKEIDLGSVLDKITSSLEATYKNSGKDFSPLIGAIKGEFSRISAQSADEAALLIREYKVQESLLSIQTEYQRKALEIQSRIEAAGGPQDFLAEAGKLGGSPNLDKTLNLLQSQIGATIKGPNSKGRADFQLADFLLNNLNIRSYEKNPKTDNLEQTTLKNYSGLEDLQNSAIAGRVVDLKKQFEAAGAVYSVRTGKEFKQPSESQLIDTASKQVNAQLKLENMPDDIAKLREDADILNLLINNQTKDIYDANKRAFSDALEQSKLDQVNDSIQFGANNTVTSLGLLGNVFRELQNAQANLKFTTEKKASDEKIGGIEKTIKTQEQLLEVPKEFSKQFPKIPQFFTQNKEANLSNASTTVAKEIKELEERIVALNAKRDDVTVDDLGTVIRRGFTKEDQTSITDAELKITDLKKLQTQINERLKNYGGTYKSLEESRASLVQEQQKAPVKPQEIPPIPGFQEAIDRNKFKPTEPSPLDEIRKETQQGSASRAVAQRLELSSLVTENAGKGLSLDDIDSKIEERKKNIEELKNKLSFFDFAPQFAQPFENKPSIQTGLNEETGRLAALQQFRSFKSQSSVGVKFDETKVKAEIDNQTGDALDNSAKNSEQQLKSLKIYSAKMQLAANENLKLAEELELLTKNDPSKYVEEYADQVRKTRDAANRAGQGLSVKDLGKQIGANYNYGPKENNRDLFNLVDSFSTDFRAGIGSAFSEAIKGAKTLREAFLDVFQSILNKLTDKTLDIAVNNLFSGITGSLGVGGKNQGGIIGYATGGSVRGGSGNKDDVFALMTGGEFVIKKSSVNKYGTDFLEKINQQRLVTKADGGDFSQVLDNKYTFNSAARPTAGKYVVDSRLSALALTDENNPQNKVKEARYNQLDQYLEDKAQYEREKTQAKKNYANKVNSVLLQGLVSAGIGVAGSYLGTLGKDKGKPAPNSGFDNAGDTNVKYFANAGGYIPRFAAGGSSKDNIPSLLMGGEFVINKEAVKTYGTDFISRINRGTLPRYASGGSVGVAPSYSGSNVLTTSSSVAANDANDLLIKTLNDLIDSLDDKGNNNTISQSESGKLGTQPDTQSSSGLSIVNNISVTVNEASGEVTASSNSDVTGDNNKSSNIQTGQKLSDLLKSQVIQIMSEQLRPNGLLYRLQDKSR